ncbi:hypothetical protein G7046_g1774 [Stylonectria norvegica]|nr:hypothetical protein G7046_g1774 [Stylonectria norvegica]
MSTIFLTGASGYVGGQVLHELVHSHPEYSITALVRNAQAAKKIENIYPRIRVVVGDLDDSTLIENEASLASIVLNLAASGHLDSVQAIHRGLQRKNLSDPAYWVQISGASALAANELASDSFVPGSESSEIYDDYPNASGFWNLIQAHPSRAVDNYILRVASDTPSIKTALVVPPIIYGLGQGPIHQGSVQIPALAKIALERGHAVRVGQGLSRWGNVHVRDLGRLFSSLAENSSKGTSDETAWGEQGLYLTGVGELTFADISDKVAAAAVEQGLISDRKVEALSKPDSDTVLPHATVLYGTNARSNARRAIEVLGWKPSEEGLDVEISRAVAEEAQSKS